MDTDRNDERTGLSRRDLIKRAGIAGAAAWTAPLVIESLTSPAGALTPGPCQPYWVKMQTNGSCFNAAPGSGPGRVCGSNVSSVSFPIPSGTMCGSSCTASCTGGSHGSLTPSISSAGSYWRVDLTSGSFFSSALSSGWTLGGRYGDLSNSSYTKVCPGGPSGDGGYTDGGTVGFVSKSVTFSTRWGSTTKSLSYVYIMFCRSS